MNHRYKLFSASPPPAYRRSPRTHACLFSPATRIRWDGFNIPSGPSFRVVVTRSGARKEGRLVGRTVVSQGNVHFHGHKTRRAGDVTVPARRFVNFAKLFSWPRNRTPGKKKHSHLGEKIEFLTLQSDGNDAAVVARSHKIFTSPTLQTKRQMDKNATH